MSTGLQELAENFKFVPKLRDLNLCNLICIYIDFNNIGEGGAKILIEHLKVLSHLEIIDLGMQIIYRILGSNYMKSVELQTIRDSFPRLTVTD